MSSRPSRHSHNLLFMRLLCAFDRPAVAGGVPEHAGPPLEGERMIVLSDTPEPRFGVRYLVSHGGVPVCSFSRPSHLVTLTPLSCYVLASVPTNADRARCMIVQQLVRSSQRRPFLVRAHCAARRTFLCCLSPPVLYVLVFFFFFPVHLSFFARKKLNAKERTPSTAEPL